jgi:dUTP pyrophosphatase
MTEYMRLSDAAQEPTRKHAFDAGSDLHSSEDTTIEPGQYKLVHTGIAIRLDKNKVAMVVPRSGLAIHNGITVMNSPGIVDSGYRGEILVNLVNHSDEVFEIKTGDRIAQLLVMSVDLSGWKEAESLGKSEDGRDASGFGSTGI